MVNSYQECESQQGFLSNIKLPHISSSKSLIPNVKKKLTSIINSNLSALGQQELGKGKVIKTHRVV